MKIQINFGYFKKAVENLATLVPKSKSMQSQNYDVYIAAFDDCLYLYSYIWHQEQWIKTSFMFKHKRIKTGNIAIALNAKELQRVIAKFPKNTVNFYIENDDTAKWIKVSDGSNTYTIEASKYEYHTPDLKREHSFTTVADESVNYIPKTYSFTQINALPKISGFCSTDKYAKFTDGKFILTKFFSCNDEVYQKLYATDGGHLTVINSEQDISIPQTVCAVKLNWGEEESFLMPNYMPLWKLLNNYNDGFNEFNVCIMPPDNIEGNSYTPRAAKIQVFKNDLYSSHGEPFLTVGFCEALQSYSRFNSIEKLLDINPYYEITLIDRKAFLDFLKGIVKSKGKYFNAGVDFEFKAEDGKSNVVVYDKYHDKEPIDTYKLDCAGFKELEGENRTGFSLDIFYLIQILESIKSDNIILRYSLTTAEPISRAIYISADSFGILFDRQFHYIIFPIIN